MVSSLVVTVLLDAVGASFAPFTVKVIVEDVVVVPSETVKVNTSVTLSPLSKALALDWLAT